MKSFEDLKVGDVAQRRVDVSEEFVERFVTFSGDTNPLHVDRQFAARTRFKRPVVHGLSYAALFSEIIGTELPGPGALWMSQSFTFVKPVSLGDSLSLRAEVKAISQSTRSLTMDCLIVNQHGETVLTGTGVITVLELTDQPQAAVPVKRRALVIGGSRGIGAAIVNRLARADFNVAFTYRHSQVEAEALAASFNNVTPVRADASNPDDAERMINDVARRLRGVPDTVVFCASDMPASKVIDEVDASTMARHLRINLEYPHRVASLCIPDMRRAKFGCIVAVGTIYAEMAPPENIAPYVVSKAALAALIRCLAVDCGKDGIRANLVAPSETETALLSGLSDRDRKVASRRNPMRRLATPDDVAGAVAFLTSRDSSYVNGETIIVSGGSVMK